MFCSMAEASAFFPDPYPIDMLVVLIHITTVYVLRVLDGTQLLKLVIYVIIVSSLDCYHL